MSKKQYNKSQIGGTSPALGWVLCLCSVGSCAYARLGPSAMCVCSDGAYTRLVPVPVPSRVLCVCPAGTWCDLRVLRWRMPSVGSCACARLGPVRVLGWVLVQSACALVGYVRVFGWVWCDVRVLGWVLCVCSVRFLVRCACARLGPVRVLGWVLVRCACARLGPVGISGSRYLRLPFGVLRYSLFLCSATYSQCHSGTRSSIRMLNTTSTASLYKARILRERRHLRGLER